MWSCIGSLENRSCSYSKCLLVKIHLGKQNKSWTCSPLLMAYLLEWHHSIMVYTFASQFDSGRRHGTFGGSWCFKRRTCQIKTRGNTCRIREQVIVALCHILLVWNPPGLFCFGIFNPLLTCQWGKNRKGGKKKKGWIKHKWAYWKLHIKELHRNALSQPHSHWHNIQMTWVSYKVASIGASLCIRLCCWISLNMLHWQLCLTPTTPGLFLNLMHSLICLPSSNRPHHQMNLSPVGPEL